MPPRSRLGFREETQNYAKRNRSQIFFKIVFLEKSIQWLRLYIIKTHCMSYLCVFKRVKIWLSHAQIGFLYVPVNSKTGHLTHVKLRTVGNLTFAPKRLSAVGNKRISQFFDSAREPRSQGHCSCRFHVGFSVVVVLCSYIVEYAFV